MYRYVQVSAVLINERHLLMANMEISIRRIFKACRPLVLSNERNNNVVEDELWFYSSMCWEGVGVDKQPKRKAHFTFIGC